MKPFVEPDTNFRLEQSPIAPHLRHVRQDFVEPLPVGSVVAITFQITGYDQDCDGGAMARLMQVDAHGEPTGWVQNHLGLYADSCVVLDSFNELHTIAAGR